jgi:hypothetical protein
LFKIYDTNGKAIWSERRSANESLVIVDLQKLHVSRGLYFMRIETADGNSLMRKFLVD